MLSKGLNDIRAAALVRRDVKPGNVILGVDGPRVIDLGPGRLADKQGPCVQSGEKWLSARLTWGGRGRRRLGQRAEAA